MADIKTGGCGSTPCNGGRRRRQTKKSAGRRRRGHTKKRGGFVGDALLATAAVGTAYYGRKMTHKGGKRLPHRKELSKAR